MKICDVTQFYSPVSGGVKRYVQEKRRYVNAHTSDEHVLIIPGDETATRIEGRCRVQTIRSPLVDRTSRYRVLWNIPALRRALDEERPDVIECGDPYHVAWAVLSWARRARVPVAGFYHSHFPDAYLRTLDRWVGATARDFVQDLARDYIRRLYSRFAATFVPSPHLADLLRGWGVANAAAVRLGVDAEVFCPGPPDPAVRRELGIPPDRRLLLTVGRLAGEKNVAGVLAAFRVLHAREPGRYHLMLVGDGPLRPLVERAAAETGAVTWRSYYDDSARLAAVYRAADLMVHPGVNETFGLVTVEAQACGLPVAAFRGTFMDRLAFCGVEHWASERTPEALAAAVERLMSGDRGALGARVAAAAADYAWPRVFDELFARYRALL